MHRLAMTILMATALGACGKANPASQAPVELKPGLYELTATGGTLVQLRNQRVTDQLCLTPDALESFADNPLGHVALDWDGCSDSADPPRGNAFSGRRSCDIAGDRRASVDAPYQGSHTADSFELHGHVAQSNDKEARGAPNGSGDFSITGKRVGDCPEAG